MELKFQLPLALDTRKTKISPNQTCQPTLGDMCESIEHMTKHRLCIYGFRSGIRLSHNQMKEKIVERVFDPTSMFQVKIRE
jgi:hypothetical protein